MATAAAAALLLSACASLSGSDTRRGSECATTAGESDRAHTRRVLNEGYSMLRKDANTLATVHLLLYVKSEQDFFAQYVNEVSAYGKQLKDKLDELPAQFPALRVDLDPLPELEKRKRLATGIDKFIDIAPVIGKSGREFERTLLISLSNGLNQERHLLQEMGKLEPDAALRQFLDREYTRMNTLYEQSETLLIRHYYR